MSQAKRTTSHRESQTPVAVLVFTLFTLFGALRANAAAAPHLDWRTLRSECCDVHFPAALEPLARRVATISDESVAIASAFLDSAPLDRVHVVLHDVTDVPNGFTQVVPYDLIDLRTVTPDSDSELGVTDEYLRLLIQHEMLHVVHLDTIHGFPAAVNLVIGKVWPPNLVQPRFVVEGLATYVETRFTGGGRLTSTQFRSEIVIAALAGDVWQLDDLSAYSRRNPGGGAAYAYGAAFIEWLSSKYGSHIWSSVAHDYGGTIIPYAMQRSIEARTGRSLEDDYADFVTQVQAHAEELRTAVMARGGPTKARRLTRVGGSVRTPRFLSDGTLVVSLDPPNAPAGLYAISGLPRATPTLEPIVRVNQAVDVAVVDDEIFFTQSDVTRAWYSFNDLWRATGTGAIARLTHQARLRAPAEIPGTRAVVAEQRSALGAALVILDIDTAARGGIAVGAGVRDLVRATQQEGTTWFSPSVSPDGRRVVASRWTPGGARELVEISLDDVARVHDGRDARPTKTAHEHTHVRVRERVLTHDGAQDIDPVYTLDGKHVLFASDREGPFSIYAIDVETREVRRIVDSLGLARMPRPTPDGAGLVFVDTHVEGQDLYAAQLDIAAAPIVSTPSGERALPPYARPHSTPSTAAVEPYDPLPTLLPRYWIPLVANDPTGAPAIGAAVAGADAAALFSWAAQATWATGLQRPRASTSWRMHNLFFPLTLSAEWRTDVSTALRRTDGLPDVQQETVLRGSAFLSVPYARSRRFLQSISFGYARELHIVENPITSPPDARAPRYPPSGTVGAVTFDWSSSSIESYRDSVSAERGFATFLRLRHANALLLSDHDLTEVIVDARAFHPVPGLGGHVLGLYLSGGVAFGEALRRTGFSLGGLEDRDLTRDLLEGRRSGGGVLRGYPTVTLAGDAQTLATLEYRWPVLEVERGISTLPLFFERVHGAVFTDLGLAFDGVPVPNQYKASVGAELRANVTLGYYGYFLVRAGFARGVSRDGLDQPYLVLGFPY